MQTLRPLENLSRHQRQATPPELAAELITLIHTKFPGRGIAILWCSLRGPYASQLSKDQLWHAGRNANHYPGPHPIIAHPPCGPWGKYRHNCNHSRQDAINAMHFVHRFGGIVEHPVGSDLFKLHQQPGAKIIRFNQAAYGHQSLKPTLLYFFNPYPHTR